MGAYEDGYAAGYAAFPIKPPLVDIGVDDEERLFWVTRVDGATVRRRCRLDSVGGLPRLIDVELVVENLDVVPGNQDEWLARLGRNFYNEAIAAVTILPVLLREDASRGGDHYREVQRRRRSRLTPADYQRVADVYRQAVADGRPVQQAVADDFFVGRQRGASLIAEARRRGLLPQTTKGKKQA
jgi:hypothetical protein